MAKIKKVGFNFFRPVISKDKKNTYFSFKDIFECVRKEYLNGREQKIKEYKKIYSYNNEPAKLADITVDIETQYYHLVFERLDYQVPNRTTLHGDSEAIELREDEYIGIDVNILYDSINDIFMLQRNRSAIGPTGIQAFLNTLIDEYVGQIDGEFALAIVSDNAAKKRAFKQKAYRNLHFKVTGVKAQGIIEKLTQRTDVGVENVEIILSTKSSSKSKIDDDFAVEILEKYIDDPDVQKLKIRAIEDDGYRVEPIDLIDQKLETFCEFELQTERSLNPISVFNRMNEIYVGKDYKNTVLRMCNELESVV